jgi:hypothetical protein
MDLTALIVQLVSGAVGGSAAGAVAKQYSLGHWATPSLARSAAAFLAN